MQNRSILLLLTSVVTALCVYYLSFTFIGRGIENDAIENATGKDGAVNPFKKQQYLDSIWTEPVFDLGFASYTYKQVKENEVKLGLDLQGGMNVTMEVSAGDILQVLSNNSKNPAYVKALNAARQQTAVKQEPFVKLFYDNFKTQASGATLASIFSNKTNRDKITLSSSDDQVIKYLNEEVTSTIDRSFEILRTRIDKFGVTQPNIQLLKGTNRIQIELPGVDNPERVRKLLQGVAKLEFFEMYEGNAFNDQFVKLNDYLVKEEADLRAGRKTAAQIAEANGGEAPMVADSNAVNTTDTASVKKAEADKALAANSKKGGDSATKVDAKKDSAAAANKQSATLQKILVPMYNGFGVAIKDTNKWNRLIKRKDIKNLFNDNLAFIYAVKPQVSQDGKEILEVYPIRKGREGKAPLEGDVITDARPDFGQTGAPEVTMQMNTRGAREWKRLTAANIKRRIAIVLDNVVYSAPTVQNEIPNGNSSISGSFTVEEAKDLANILKAGKMPVQTRIVEEVVVGPTLGKESITKGLVSIIAGFLTIIIFMIAYYSNSGIIANVAVLLNVVLILGILVPVGAVLTLPGIAGIVLTIGMAVDANVLINERVKDELRAGASPEVAIRDGYKAASTSIFDANLTTMIAGIVLFYFGSGPVQGFATTLIIGIVTSLFTSVYVTRLITEWRLSKGKEVRFTTGLSKNLFTNLNFDFVSKRKIAYAASSIFILAGIISLFTSGLNYGVDFNGGWSYTVKFKNDVSTDQVRTALTPFLKQAPEVKTFGEASRLKITTSYLINDDNEDAAKRVEAEVINGLKTLPNNAYEIQSSSKVGPTVANDIKNNSIIGIIVAMLGIFTFIWFRFRKWEYALGAIIAVLHDTMIIITIYTLCKDILPFSLEVDQNFLAAVLTIAGYSVNDTVVIFDRIREGFRDTNMDKDPKKLINQALNFTFSRTVITASTVLVVVLILLIFGGETIRGLSFALLIGVITGTYSTIYIAVPFLIDARKNKVVEADTTAPAAINA